MTLERCEFRDNSKKGSTVPSANLPHENPSPQDLGGSALSVYRCALNLSETQFTNNSADIGGAVDVRNAPVRAKRCEFRNNKAMLIAGAIFCDKIDASFQHCRFEGNSGEDGGAVLVFSGNVTFSRCSITKNNATNEGGGVIAFGDATFYDCDISNNTALRRGGLFVEGVAKFSRCSFKHNSAGFQGGALDVRKMATLNNCTFTNNVAGRSGGAIMSVACSLTCNELIMRHNRAEEGGAILTVDGVVNFTDCRFEENLAKIGGGAGAFRRTNVTVKVTTVFKSNYARIGGALELQEGSYFKIAGGSIHSQSITRFISNMAYMTGGAIACIQCGTLLFYTYFARRVFVA